MKRIFLCLVLVLSTSAFAQEFRATVAGRVMDSSGAVIPRAKVLVTNAETGVKVETTSDKAGSYTVPFLLPGQYSVSASAAGFDTFVHDNITLQTGAKVEEDLVLKIGTATQEVHVSSDNTLIETSSSTLGQVLTAKEIEDLPDNGRSPLGLAKTEEGVVPKAKNSVVQTRPFDNSATSDFSIGGGNSQSNEYLLNGVPNMQDSARVPGFSPQLDSVDAIRVDVFQSDASYGDTSGGTVNLTTKAGTNVLHGTASEFNQFSAINAPQRWFVPANQVTPATRQNQYGVTLGGPVVIPKVFNGRDKVFFFYSFEKFKDTTPNATTTSVPTVAERSGDFSALLKISSAYQLYDPFSGTLNAKGVIVRTPLTNNQVTAINPVAKALLQYFPLPNLPGGPDGESNFFSNVPQLDDYNSQSGRMDVSINDRNKIFFETHRSEYFRQQSNVFNNIATGTTTYNVYSGGVLDYIHTFSASTTLDSRASLTRTYANSTLPSLGFDATSVGLPSYIDANATARVLPRIAFSETSGTTAFAGLSTTTGGLEAFDTFQVFAALTKVAGKHTLKIGPDLRLEKFAKTNGGSPAGNFTFGTTFMTNPVNGVAIPFGASFASFLSGVPTSGTQTISVPALYNAGYFAGFIQDDWRALPSLTLNLGLRLEHETPINESNNRAVVGFDPSAVNSVTAPAEKAYAAAYNPAKNLVPVAAFTPTGGVIYASPNQRSEYNTAPVYISPRLGFAFSPASFHGRTAIRGGVGIYVNPFNDYNTPQSYGFSATTAYVASNNSNVTPATTLSDPFPASNPIQQVTGSALGVNQNLGSSITFRGPGLKVPYAERWSLDVQQQLTKNMMVDIGYIGAHQVHLSYSNATSSIPALPYLSRAPRADPNNTALITTAAPCGQTPTQILSCVVTNPFKGLPNETGSLATSSTVTNLALLQSNPEYSSVGQQLVPGASASFHQLLARLHMRATGGLQFNANYEYSRSLITGQLNAGGPLSYQESTSDYPHHFSFTGNYALPFGRGRRFLSRSGVLEQLVGGFQMNAIYQFLSGTPIQWGNVDFATGSNGFHQDFQVQPRNFLHAFNTSAFYTGTGLGYKAYLAGTPGADPTDTGQPSSTYNYRTFPQYFFRSDFTNDLDASIIKSFYAGERVRIEYRFEAFNVLNHVQFGSPSVSPTAAVGLSGVVPTGFGTISSLANSNRTIQQGLRIAF